MADETNTRPPTMRERLAQALCAARSPHDGLPMLGLDPDFCDRPTTKAGCDDELSEPEVLALVDAVLAELANPDADTIQATARAIGIADSGTDIEFIGAERGSHITYTACAKAGIAALVDSIREDD